MSYFSLHCWVVRFFIYPKHKSLIRSMICRYFVGCLFTYIYLLIFLFSASFPAMFWCLRTEPVDQKLPGPKTWYWRDQSLTPFLLLQTLREQGPQAPSLPSHTWRRLFTFLVVFFKAQNFKVLLKSNLLIFSCVICVSGVISKTALPSPRSQRFTPVLSFKSSQF